MSESPFVRVELDNDMEATLSRAFVDGTDGAIKVLDDEPATNTWGQPLPATRKDRRPVKPRTTVKDEAAKKTTAKAAGDSESTKQ